jgi:hypothetical protein
MGDEALNTATGRGWDEWFTLLDAAGAADWPHPQIVRWPRSTLCPPGSARA